MSNKCKNCGKSKEEHVTSSFSCEGCFGQFHFEPSEPISEGKHKEPHLRESPSGNIVKDPLYPVCTPKEVKPDTQSWEDRLNQKLKLYNGVISKKNVKDLHDFIGSELSLQRKEIAEEVRENIPDLLHDFLRECIREPFDGSPLLRKARKNRYADTIASRIENK